MTTLALNSEHPYPLPVEIRVFRPLNAPIMARLYTEGQHQALGRHDIHHVASSLDGWWENPNAYALALVHIKEKKLLGGVRIHINSPEFPMPMMSPLKSLFPQAYVRIQNDVTSKIAEICGIWRAPEAPKTKYAHLLTSKAILMAKEIGVKRLYGFAGEHSLSILENELFTYDALFQRTVSIPYPDRRYRSRVCFRDLNCIPFDPDPEIKLVRLGII